jgi:signal transduction histidine kinase
VLDDKQEDLLSIAIHDLRDPLSGLVNAAEMLREATGLDQQTSWAAAVVERQSRCLVALLEDLATTSDLARGKLELRLERVDLEPLVRQAVELVRPDMMVRRQQLRLDTALGPVPVWGDSALLLQALTRLLEHAVRETGVGEAITLALRSTASAASLRLLGPAGTGARTSRSPERHLGLVLVRRVTALHGGVRCTVE